MGKEKVYTFTHYELNKYVQKVTRLNLSLFLAAAVEEFGWSVEDVVRFADRLRRYNDAVDEKLITLRDIERMISDEIGADIFTDIYMHVKP